MSDRVGQASSAARFLIGLKAASPVMLGYLPIAMSFGLVAQEAGMPLVWAGAMSALVYAGASQFAAAAMLKLGAPTPEIVVATFFMNLRHTVMSLALLPKVKGGVAARAVLAAGITDETFAVASFSRDPALKSPAGLAGLFLGSWASWFCGTLLGGGLAVFLPKLLTDAMEVMLYGLFIGLLVPALRAAPRGLVAALSAMAAHLIAKQFLPPGWAIVVAILTGSAIGAWAEQKRG